MAIDIIKLIEEELNSRTNDNKLIEFELKIKDNNVYLNIIKDSGVVTKINDLAISPIYLNKLYIAWYEELKNAYLKNDYRTLIFHEINDYFNDPYITFYIKGNHNVKIKLDFKEHLYANEVIQEIRTDWSNIVKEIKEKRIR